MIAFYEREFILFLFPGLIIYLFRRLILASQLGKVDKLKGNTYFVFLLKVLSCDGNSLQNPYNLTQPDAKLVGLGLH